MMLDHYQETKSILVSYIPIGTRVLLNLDPGAWLVGPAGSNLQPDRYERRILPENPWWNGFRVSNLKE
jgi:hypothetical protein